MWHASFLEIQTRSSAQRATNSQLLSSLFPPIPAKEAIMAVSAPEEWWHLKAPDTLHDCTMLQMDIKSELVCAALDLLAGSVLSKFDVVKKHRLIMTGWRTLTTAGI